MTKNAAVFSALTEDFIPSRNNIEAKLNLLAALVADGTNEGFRAAVYAQRVALGRNIGVIDWVADDELWGYEADEDEDFLSENGDGAANTLAALRELARRKHRLFTKLSAVLAVIENADDTMIRDMDELGDLDIEDHDLAPVQAVLGPDAHILDEAACQIIIQAAKEKALALRTRDTKEAAIVKAEDSIGEIDDAINQADNDLAAALQAEREARLPYEAALEAVNDAKDELKRAEAALWTIFNREGKFQDLQDCKAELGLQEAALAEVQTAYRLVCEQAREAEAQHALVVASRAQAEEALDSARAEDNVETAITLANTAREKYLLAYGAVDKVNTASRGAETHKDTALDPTNPNHKLKRLNFLMEYNGLLGFTDHIVFVGGEAPTARNNDEEYPELLQVAPCFQGVRLSPGETIHATQAFEGGGEIRLVQDWQGKITNQSTGYLTEEQQAMAALKQAKMLLLNYKPEKGDVLIRGGTLAQANRVYAALLMLSQNNPDITLRAEDIKSTVMGCTGPGAFQSQGGFINTHLGCLDKVTRAREEATLITLQNTMKERFQDTVRLEELPEGIQFSI